jgi:hypothetical protein
VQSTCQPLGLQSRMEAQCKYMFSFLFLTHLLRLDMILFFL